MKTKTYEYLTYYSPSFIYIPYDNIDTLNIRKDKKVFNNMHLGTRKDNSNIFSSVSGIIVGSKKMNYLDGTYDSLIIENDFIERRKKISPFKELSMLNKNEINDLLIKYGLYKRINSKTILIVKSTFSKKDYGDMVINYESYEEILESIDELLEVYKIKNCYIVIPNDDLVSRSAFNKYINAFPNICITNSDKKIKNNKSVIYSIEDVLAVNKAVHLDYLLDNTMITINSKDRIVVRVKLFSSLIEVLDALKIKYKNKKVYVNDKFIEDISDFVITRNIKIVEIK